MLCVRVRLPFLAAVCGCLVGSLSDARAEPVGDLGAADRLVVRGLEEIPAASLRQNLLDNDDLYWLGIPTADRAAYLTALRTRVPLALEAAGFPQPRVTVEVGPGPDGKESVLVDVVAGRRLTAGPIRVSGIPDDMAQRLVTYLQEASPPTDAVPETITLSDGTTTVLWFDAAGNRARLLNPAWTPGDPAPCGERCEGKLLGFVYRFFCREGYCSLAGWKVASENGYLEAIREHVDLEVRAEGKEAVLAIDVKQLPARTTLAGIEVNEGLRTTFKELMAYLGLEVGQPVTAADRQAWLGKLRLSGRFIRQACRFEPRDGGCVARFELVEYQQAAPLDRGASPEQEALLRARAWLLGEWCAGREIRLQLTEQGEDKAVWLSADLIAGEDTGSVVQVKSGKGSYGMAWVQGTTGLFADTSRFEGTLPTGWAPRMTIKLSYNERDRCPSTFVRPGVGSSARFAFEIEPVCCNLDGMASRRDGDDLVIGIPGCYEFHLDAASGRLRQLVVVRDSGCWVVHVETGEGLVAAAVADLRERSGKNLADASRPVSSTVRFVLANPVPFVSALAIFTKMDASAIAPWIEWLQDALDGDCFAAIDAAVGEGLCGLWDAETTAAIDGVPVQATEDQIRRGSSPELAERLAVVVALVAATALRRVEQRAGRDSAAATAVRAAVLWVCTADHAAAARELARVPAASLWTPDMENRCAALGPQGRDLDRRVREALAYLHGIAGDTAWSVAAHRRLLAEAEERHGPDHPETAKYLHNLVCLLNQTGEETEAYALSRRPQAAIETGLGLHPPVPARFKQPSGVAKKDDAKAQKPAADKAHAAQGDSSPAAEFERWGGLETGIRGTRR